MCSGGGTGHAQWLWPGLRALVAQAGEWWVKLLCFHQGEAGGSPHKPGLFSSLAVEEALVFCCDLGGLFGSRSLGPLLLWEGPGV